jgi:hypothetical protein
MRHLTPLAAMLGLACFASCSSTSPGDEPARTLETAPARAQRTIAALHGLGAFPAKPTARAELPSVLPAHAAAPLHLGRGDVWLEVTPRSLRERATAVSADEGSTVYADAAEDLDLVYARDAGRVEELRLARTRAAAGISAWELRLGPGLATVQVVDGRVEAVDHAGIVRFATEPAFAIDATGVRRPLALALHGRTLEARLDVEGLATPIAIDPAWTAVASPSGLTRVSASLTKLASGKVLLAGGEIMTTGTALSTGEVYDPVSNTWTATANTLSHPRSEHTATRFGGASRKVILVGGFSVDNTDTTAELYDEATNSFTGPVTLPNSPGTGSERRAHGAVTLANGQVLVVGGRGGSTALNSMFLASDLTLTPLVATLPNPVSDPNVVVLPDGRVLVASGDAATPSGMRYFKTTVLLTVTGTSVAIAPAANLPVGRIAAIAVVADSGPNKGKVLLVGGAVTNPVDESTVVPSQGGVIYDPAANTWTPLPSFMATKRNAAAGGLLPGGRLLVAGGMADSVINGPANADAEILDLATMTWRSAGKLVEPRAAPVAALLDDGSLLLQGGVGAIIDGVLSLPAISAERFALQANGAACAADGQCNSSVCVDGLCCDRACDGQCEACDVAGSAGTCKVVTGVPHGARTKCRAPGLGEDPACAESCNGTDKACKPAATTVSCSVDACAAGTETHASTCDGAGKCKDVPKSCGDYVCDAKACKTACASKADCPNPAHFCEAGKCIPQQASGSACNRDVACATGLCVDGVCCASKCDGQCQACDVPGQVGNCVAIKGKPHGLRSDCTKDSSDACKSLACDGTNTASCAATVGPCGNYACDDGEKVCKKTCATNAECVAGFECDSSSGKCVPRTSKCIGVDTLQAADGTETRCDAFACRDGACLNTCGSSNDCQNGYACDVGKCVSTNQQAASSAGSSGGCATAGTTGGASTSPGSAAGWLAALALLAVGGRKARRTPR